jgi:hypothetical protein
MRNESKIAKRSSKFPPLGDFEVGWPKWGSGQRVSSIRYFIMHSSAGSVKSLQTSRFDKGHTALIGLAALRSPPARKGPEI